MVLKDFLLFFNRQLQAGSTVDVLLAPLLMLVLVLWCMEFPAFVRCCIWVDELLELGCVDELYACAYIFGV